MNCVDCTECSADKFKCPDCNCGCELETQSLHDGDFVECLKCGETWECYNSALIVIREDTNDHDCGDYYLNYDDCNFRSNSDREDFHSDG